MKRQSKFIAFILIALLLLGMPAQAVVTSSTTTSGGGLPSQTGNNGKFLKTNGTTTSWATVSGGTGTVTSVSCTTANGVSCTVATATSTPALTIVLGAITPSSVAATGVLSSGANSGTGGQLTLNGSTSGSVAVKVAAAAGTSTIFQLPADNGTNTYLLQTNGSGVTSWVAPPSATIALGTSAAATNPQRSGDATTGLFSPASNAVAIAAGSAEIIRVNASGVAIGTTTPKSTAGLTVSGYAGGVAVVNGSSTLELKATGTGGGDWYFTSNDNTINTLAGTVQWYDATTNTSPFTIEGNGRIQTLSGGVWGFSSIGDFPNNSSCDTAITRGAAAEIDIGTCTSGNKSGTLKLTTVLATGNVTGAALIPSGSTVPTNGMYLSAANTLDFSTNTGKALEISSAKHIAFQGTAPAVSSCGTSPSIDANATDMSGTVTVGSVAAASCTVTFNVPYASYVHCRVTSQSTLTGFGYTYTTSAITVTATSLIGDLFDYECDGK